MIINVFKYFPSCSNNYCNVLFKVEFIQESRIPAWIAINQFWQKFPLNDMILSVRSSWEFDVDILDMSFSLVGDVWNLYYPSTTLFLEWNYVYIFLYFYILVSHK